MPREVTAGQKFDIKINFDGAILKKAVVYVLKMPTEGYEDPETGVVIKSEDAEKQIDEANAKDAGKIHEKSDDDAKKERNAGGKNGRKNELKKFTI